jgi:hypothetical protein
MRVRIAAALVLAGLMLGCHTPHGARNHSFTAEEVSVARDVLVGLFCDTASTNHIEVRLTDRLAGGSSSARHLTQFRQLREGFRGNNASAVPLKLAFNDRRPVAVELDLQREELVFFPGKRPTPAFQCRVRRQEEGVLLILSNASGDLELKAVDLGTKRRVVEYLGFRVVCVFPGLQPAGEIPKRAF